MLAIANFSRLIILRFRLNVRQRANKGITYHFGMFQSFQKFLNRACAISVYRTRVSCPSLASEITEAEDGEQSACSSSKRATRSHPHGCPTADHGRLQGLLHWSRRTVTHFTAPEPQPWQNRPPIMEACHVETTYAGWPDAAVRDHGGSDAADATRHRRRDGNAATGLFPPAQ